VQVGLLEGLGYRREREIGECVHVRDALACVYVCMCPHALACVYVSMSGMPLHVCM